MNVLDFYNTKHIKISEPLELEDENYFCKLSYNNAPFIIKTNKVCYYKNRKSSNYIYISLTSKDYLEWFERFYHDIILHFHHESKEWFEDEMTHSDIECSFINPLKTNIKDNCFDVMCSIDENRIMVTDTKDDIYNFSEVPDHEVIPTFHIKGIKFNNKHFALDIELNHLYLLLDSNTEETLQVHETEPLNEVQASPELNHPEEIRTVDSSEVDGPEVERSEVEPEVVQVRSKIDPDLKEIEDPLSEFVLNTENIDDAEIHLDNLTIYKIYEFLNTRIKESLIEEIRTVFTSKKIKSRIDFSEVIDDEETEE